MQQQNVFKTSKLKLFILKKIGLNLNKFKFKIKKNHFYKLNIYKKNLDNRNYLRKLNNFYFNIKNYKNYRNQLGYPIRGQRTHTNAKTKKKFKILSEKQ